MLAGENEDPRCHWSYRSRTRLVLFGHRLQKQSKNMKALLLWWPMLGLSTEPPYSHVTLQLLNSFWICLPFMEVRYWACLHRGQHLVPTDYLNFRAFFSSGTHHSAWNTLDTPEFCLSFLLYLVFLLVCLFCWLFGWFCFFPWILY